MRFFLKQSSEVTLEFVVTILEKWGEALEKKKRNRLLLLKMGGKLKNN